MTVTAPLLTRRAVLQCAIEAAYGTEAAVGANDALYVEDPNYGVDVALLERNFARDDLSPLANIVGRRTASMTFSTELKGSGFQDSGLAANAPMVSRLLRACGYALTPYASPSISPVFAIGNHENEASFTSSGVAALGTLTMTDNFTDGDEVVIGTKTFTMQDTLTNVDGNVHIGASLAASLTNLRNAVNGSGGVTGTDYAAATVAHTQVTATATGTTLVATAKQKGTYGNAIATTTTTGDGSWGAATLASGTNVATTTEVVSYVLEVTTGGASGAAQITVTSDTAGQSNAAATVTTATPFTVGSLGLTLTPVFTGDLNVGQSWVVWLMPPGIRLMPISDNFESLSMFLNMDGVQHKMLGTFGTFSLNAEAGDYARIEFDMQGTFEDPIDAALPVCNYEKSLPSQVELARLRLDQDYIIVNAFSFTQGNDIQIRPDVSSEEGYVGTRIVSRAPEGGIDPEAELVANHDFWGRLGAAQRMPFQMRIGTQAGNTVWYMAPSTQYTGLTYQDRNGIRTYDAQLRFSRVFGNDECMFFFC